MLLGQKSGFAKYPCSMCESDSRDRINHSIKRDWPLREFLRPGYRNILHPALVDRSNVILPPLHIKLGPMKQFVKVLNKGACLKYILEKKHGFAEVLKFLGNTKDSDCKTIVENIWACFEALECCMTLKVHFLHAHLRLFSTKLG